jgi:hypothetical protein
MQMAIEAELSISFREDKGLHDRKKQMLFGTPSQGMDGGLFGEAKNLDGQATSSEILEAEDGDLISVRFM